MRRRQVNVYPSGRADIQIRQHAADGTEQSLVGINEAHLVIVTIEERLNQAKRVTITFVVKDAEYLWSILHPFFVDSQLPKTSLRFGIISGSECVWRDWETYYLSKVQSNVVPDPQGRPTVSITLEDGLYLLSSSIRSSAVSGSVSTAVRSVWSRRHTEQAEVEGTALPSSGSSVWYQLAESDLEFLHRLRGYAANAAGVAGYCFYVSSGKLHFRLPGSGSNGILGVRYAAGEPGFTNLLLSSQTTGEFSTCATWDHEDGQAAVSLTDRTLKQNLASGEPKSQFDSLEIAHVGPNQRGAEVARVQDQYATAAYSRYQASLTGTNCLDFQVGDLVDLDLTSDVQRSSLSGLWVVFAVVYTLQDGKMLVSPVLARPNLEQYDTIVGQEDTYRDAPASFNAPGFRQVGTVSVTVERP